MSLNANSPVFTGCLELAKKYNVQDISYRAYVGRIKKVTGIVISTSEIITYHMGESDHISKPIRLYGEWFENQIGEEVLGKIETEARQHYIHLLEMYLLGFIPTEVLVKDFKVTKKMDRECGGNCKLAWDRVLNEIQEYRDRVSVSKKTAKKKESAKADKPKKPETVLERIQQICNFENVTTHISKGLPEVTQLRSASEIESLDNDYPRLDQILILGNKLLKSPDITSQFGSHSPMIVNSSKEFSIYLIWHKNKKTKILFSIDQDYHVFIEE